MNGNGGADRQARLLAYGVGPVALVLLLVLRGYGLVAQAPPWAYAAAIGGSAISSRIVERWGDAKPGTVQLEIRVFAHIAAVTVVIYMSGWGPALGMAYAFTAFADLEQSGAATWRAAMRWSLVGCAIGQALIWNGWAPSFLNRSEAETLGLLGAFVFSIAIRMAGATGETKERAEALLAHQARHDALTGLPNRQVLVDRLTRATELLGLRGRKSPALMFLDLDRFKLVNDTFGHQAGDELLIEVARRLQSVLRASDTLSRFGGDEFVILLEDAGDSEDVTVLAERVRGVFGEPFQLGSEQLHVSVSIGITIVDDSLTSTAALLSEADAAMYFAKARGPSGKVQLFDELTRRAARQRVRIESDLAHALEREEFLLHFQPIVKVATGQTVGAEALLRWQHPQRGLLIPAEFLEPAERTGLIVPIGEWVLSNACATVTEWNTTRPRHQRLHMNVNLSPRELAEPDLVEKIKAILAQDEIDADDVRLSLELTEGWLAAEEASEFRRLRELKDLGVLLAIDDFGTGYSSLAHLRDLPVDVVKIDRGFVRGVGERSRDRVIVKAMVELAHELEMLVVAEGVETADQYDALSQLGCDYAQGFYLGRPHAAAQFISEATPAPAPTVTGASR